MEPLAKTLLITTLAGCGSFATITAQAGEPLAKMATSIIHAGGNARTSASLLRLPANRLDLAPPTIAPATHEKAPESFPSFNRHGAATPEEQSKFGGLNNPVGNQRVPSRAEQLVRNFHRDGLPVARLFQSENSLVHLGLNQKGKPGLWVVQKIH
jgi:hypothetical protein